MNSYELGSCLRGYPLRCDACGRFIPWQDLDDGTASRTLITPDSDYSKETYETLCRVHVQVSAPKYLYDNKMGK